MGNHVIATPDWDGRDEMLAADLPWTVHSVGTAGPVVTRFATLEAAHAVRWPRGARVGWRGWLLTP